MPTNVRWEAGCLRRVLTLPTYADETEARTARFAAILATAGVAATLVAAAVALAEPEPDRVTAITLGVLGGFCALALGLVRAGAVGTSGWVLVLAAIAGTTTIVLGGPSRGFGDIGMMLYPALVVNANLLLDRRGSAIALGLILTTLAGVLAVELSGAFGPRILSDYVTEDFGFAVIIVMFAAVTSGQLAGSLKQSVAHARRDEEALAEVNRRLEAEGDARETLIEELEARNAELERFTYTVSHDLKSPLVTIGGFLGYLERHVVRGDLDRFRRFLDRIKVAHLKMARLLEDLLEVSRAGRLNPQPGVSLAEVVAEARELVAGALGRMRTRVVVADPLPRVRADRGRLVEVIQNLLENAAKFTSGVREPRVEIGVRDSDAGPIIFVRDNGIGIEPEHHDKVFRLFEKVRPEIEGTGIGLALVKRIVEAHGGSIWVESEGTGRGATFCFTLESGEDASPASPRAARQPPESPGMFMVEALALGRRGPAGRGFGWPTSSAEDEAGAARFVAVVATVGIVAPLVVAALMAVESQLDRISAITFGATSGACGVVLWLVSRRATATASWAMIFVGVACTTMLLLTGPVWGFADIGMMLFPLLVIVASLLLDQRGFLVALVLILAALVGVWAVEVSGVLGPPPSLSPDLVLLDFWIAVLIVVISALTSRLLASSLLRSAGHARRNEATLAAANRRLEVEAGGRERLIEELELRNRELERFSYSVSHDLKTPLVTIAGFLGYLERHAATRDLDLFRGDLRRIEAARSKMARLLDELLALSRIGRVSDRQEDVPFAEVVAGARERLAGALDRRGTRMIVADRLPVVRGDSTELIEIVYNLLDNAIKFTAGVPEPRVEVGARDGEDGPVFFVRDNGVGIEPEYHDKVFELFATLSPADENTGVGLALAKRIVEVHGGKIWVESEGKGRGATFCFTLAASTRG